MELIKPPTDNLYKFVGISGMALTIAGLLMISSVSNDLREYHLSIYDAAANLLASEQELGPRQEEFELAWLKIEAKHETMIDHLRMQQKAGYTAIRVGGIFAAIGGIFWWLKVQRYEDRRIIAEIKTIEKGS